MWGMASQLDDNMISALSDYFSRQRPAAGKQTNAAAIAAGKQIFEKGVPYLQIPLRNLPR
jgi:cytochrome c553